MADRTYTMREYLEIVETLDGKYEYHDGKLVDYRAMAGAAEQHALITANFVRVLGNALQGKSCRVYSSDLIVRIARKAKYRFGDAVVICGATQFDPEDTTLSRAVTNPKLVVEVLSPTSERSDRGEKFEDYRQIDAFEEYVLVAQDRPLVKTFYRQPDGTWLFAAFSGLEAKVPLRSLGVALRLSEVYAGIDLTPKSDPEASTATAGGPPPAPAEGGRPAPAP